MLPTTSKARPSSSSSSSSSSRPNPMLLPYLRRIIKTIVADVAAIATAMCLRKLPKSQRQCLNYGCSAHLKTLWQQMDVEYTFWQMLHLCTAPKVVYQHTKYHKQTKNQWARDDPAFVVICSLLLAVATMAYCAAYDHSTAHALLVVFSVLLFHFLLTGVLLATFCWFLTNSYLREEAPNSHVVEQRVEWMYAFDVHCNSFFPMFVLLYVIHYFLSPLLVAHGFIPVLLSNLLFMVGASYYHYLNFLGYDVLPFLERTTFFLYPIGVVIVLSPILILSGFNPSRYFMNMYFSRRI